MNLNSILHLACLIDIIRKFSNFNFESILNILHNLPLFFLIRIDECNGQAFSPESTSPADPMQILVTLLRDILINNHIDFPHVYTACEHICCD